MQARKNQQRGWDYKVKVQHQTNELRKALNKEISELEREKKNINYMMKKSVNKNKRIEEAVSA